MSVAGFWPLACAGLHGLPAQMHGVTMDRIPPEDLHGVDEALPATSPSTAAQGFVPSPTKAGVQGARCPPVQAVFVAFAHSAGLPMRVSAAPMRASASMRLSIRSTPRSIRSMRLPTSRNASSVYSSCRAALS